MKKIAVLILVVTLLPFCLVGCGGKDEKRNFYSIEAVFNDDDMTLTCSQSMEYVNTSENILTEVDFFLYPNSFAEGQTPVPSSYKASAYPNGESFGCMEMESVKVTGQSVEFVVEEENKSILVVYLGKELYPDEVVEIEMEYTVSLANINHRLGYGEKTVNFGTFFPIVCVYENGFVRNGFSSSGDPFYSDVSNFEVKLSFPEEYVLASTGNQEVQSDGTVLCEAENVRDFAFVLSKEFELLSKETNGVTVNYYYYEDENAEENLEISCEAVETFEDLFGQYPYKQLSVVKTNFCFGGMEYPNLVMISDSITDKETYNYVIVHEIAHQWWYGVVGNNEYTDAWVDEGLTEYSTALFFEENEKYGLDYDVVMKNALNGYKKFVEIYSSVLGEVDESMQRDLSEFLTEPEYVNCTYTKGMLLFDSLRDTLGKQKFEKCLKNYYKEYKFENSSYEKLVKSFSKSANRDLENFFASWVEGNVKIA